MRLNTCVEVLAELSDEELVSRLQSKSGPASDLYQELFQRHYGRVAAWCLRFTGEREAALDLAQEIFLKAYRCLSRFRGDSKFSTWLYTITRNHCLTAVKKLATEPMQLAESASLQLVDVRVADTLNSMEREQSLRLMWRLISESLDETEVQVVTLHYGQEVPLAVITRLLDLRNASGAKAYIVSARRKLSCVVQSWKESQLRPTAV